MLFKDKKIDELSSDIINIINSHNVFKRYLMLIISLFIGALLFNVLTLKTNIVYGGLNGISIILKNVYDFSPSIVILVSSLILLLFSYMYLGKEHLKGVLISALVYPFFVEITSLISKQIYLEIDDMLLISIFIGIISGFANGIMYKTGFSNCGLPIISQILYKEYKIPISKSSLIINSTVVIIGGIFTGFTNVMYALIIIYINSFILDRVILGISENKAFYIVTNEDDLVSEYITKDLNHKVTIFDVKGGFLKRKDQVILTVVPTRDYYKVTEGIKAIDKDAFFLACDAYEVEGGK